MRRTTYYKSHVSSGSFYASVTYDHVQRHHHSCHRRYSKTAMATVTRTTAITDVTRATAMGDVMWATATADVARATATATADVFDFVSRVLSS